MARDTLPEKLRICLIAEKFPVLGRAGSQGFLWPIARGLAKAGHSVTVLAWQNPLGEKEVVKDDVRALFVASHNPARKDQFPQRMQQKFEQLHTSEPFHLIHSLSSASHQISREKKRYGVAVAYDVMATKMAELFALIGMSQDTVESYIKTGFRVSYRFLRSYYGRDRILLGNADGVFVNSPQQQLTLERYYLYPEKKTYRVPYGIEIGDLSQRQGSEELRQKLKIPRSAKVAVTVSDMIEKEAIVNVLHAFQKVVIKKPSSYLIVVGDGPKFKEIEFEMLNLALGHNVIMTGAVPPFEVPDYIDLANVFINIGSRTSGFEPSLLEAMAQEKVIVGSEVSPISTIVEDSVDGFLIRPADVSNLSQLLLSLFLNNISAEEVGQNARKKVLGIFDAKTMIQETLEAYEKIMLSTGRYSSKK